MRVRLQMQGIRVRAPVREDPTCREPRSGCAREPWPLSLRVRSLLLRNRRGHNSERPAYRKKQIRAEINEIETKKTIAKINKTKSCFFEKINKLDKPLARLNKKQRAKTQINRIRNEKEAVTTDPAEIQRIMRDYYKSMPKKWTTWKEWTNI